MGIYNEYNTRYGQIMVRCTLIAFALAFITKGCAHVDLVDPGMVIEMQEIEMAKEYKDVPREARPYCRLLEEEEERERKEREEEEFKKTGYNFQYGVVDGVFSFFFGG